VDFVGKNIFREYFYARWAVVWAEGSVATEDMFRPPCKALEAVMVEGADSGAMAVSLVEGSVVGLVVALAEVLVVAGRDRAVSAEPVHGGTQTRDMDVDEHFFIVMNGFEQW
jgi:hypothetical protein